MVLNAVSICLALLVTISIDCNASEGPYSRAVVESCSGCQLNRLPDVKKFIFEDVPHYQDVQFMHIQGAPPELVFYDKNEQEIERLKLAHLTREECNDLLVYKGFKKSASAKDEI